MKQAICVPYRDREAYLKIFLDLVPKYVGSRVYIGEQADDEPFNLSLCRNIAALGALEDGATDLVFQDVDIIPIEGVDYSPRPDPIVWFLNAGGLKIPAKAFTEANGFNPAFVGWGHEDVEFSTRLRSYVYWPALPEAQAARLYNLELIAGEPAQISIDYFDRVGPQFVRWPDPLPWHDRHPNWCDPAVSGKNPSLRDAILGNPRRDRYFRKHGLNQVRFRVERKDTPEAVYLRFHTKQVLRP